MVVVVVEGGCAFLVAKTELLIGHQGTEVPCMTNGKHWDGWACGDAQLRCTFIIDFFYAALICKQRRGNE